MFRCSAYREAGGFDPRILAGEEPELCARLRRKGWLIMRIDAPMTIHDAAMKRFSQWWMRAIRSGMGYGQAWSLTRHGEGEGLYRREIWRALIWAGSLPLIGMALAVLVKPALILLWPGLTALQFLRLAVRKGPFASFLSIVGKYAELIGIAWFAVRRLRGRVGGTVMYK
ncbi:glycosyltransferase family 2 protein [Novosphingobium sp. Gsoil 351]|uniref:glycosyltransferase n=1 Tax=Novosphingobium sp. Gsoil 351 TaxID=2675225 RepID=UPI001E479379|nr:glycosyltransferase family 2 protein [Novosphingobium sp. Gsoil 351]